MQALKKIPFFLFLLALFFCLNGVVENYGYIGFKDLLLLGLVIFLCMAALSGLLFLFFRNYAAASLISFFIGLWYLFFGAVQDWVKGIASFSFLGSYSFLVPMLFVLTIVFIIFLKKNQAIHSKLVLYLNILLLIYCVVDAGLLLGKQFRPIKKSEAAVSFNYSKVKTKPNVYLLIFDEYPGYQSLKDSFGFANDSLYHFLHKKRFGILPAFSNYDFTPFSMSSILNMRYVQSGYNSKKVSQQDLQNRLIEIKNGEVFSIFKKMGYNLKNFSVFDIDNTLGLSKRNSFINTNTGLLTDKIFHNRFIRTSGWLFQTGKFAIPSWKKKFLYQHEENSRYSQQMVIKTAAEKSENPSFCYAHFMMPHWPFYRDSTGAPNPDSIIANSSLLNDKDLFLSYLKYCNSEIESILATITTSDPKALVIFMSDHGFRVYKNIKAYEPFNFNNVCAVRLPQGEQLVLPTKISNVNLFRYLFNNQFGQNMPYLSDSTILLSY